jgi:hypothetical protein
MHTNVAQNRLYWAVERRKIFCVSGKQINIMLQIGLIKK